MAKAFGNDAHAVKIGYPVMIKVSAGGGKGMRIVHSPEGDRGIAEPAHRSRHPQAHGPAGGRAGEGGRI
jgi:acetyl/propionyl-CoA carboxylase alpha subunit